MTIIICKSGSLAAIAQERHSDEYCIVIILKNLTDSSKDSLRYLRQNDDNRNVILKHSSTGCL